MPQHSTFFCDPIATAEYPVKFRFPMSWSYLSSPDQNAAPTKQGSPRPMLFAASVIPAEEDALICKTENRDLGVRPQKSSDEQSEHWEMVIPKMVRSAPPARPAIAGPGPARPSFAERIPHAPAPTTSPEPFLSRLAKAAPSQWRWSLASAAVVGALVSVWALFPSPRPAVKTAPALPTAHWVSDRALFTAGAKRQRQLILYRGATQPTDFRAEFDWNPEAKAVGLVFRCADPGNYQAVRIAIASWQPSFSLVEEHFTVLEGSETAHTRKLLPWQSGRPLHFVLDGTEFAFTLSADGNRFDYWTDNRLKHGDVGFYADRNAQPLQSIRWAFANRLIPDFSGRLPEVDTTFP